MHLATHYTPGSFLRPCLIVDTVFNSNTKETAIKFIDALNNDHASDFVYCGSKDRSEGMQESKWIVVATYRTVKEAVEHHLDMTKHFHNGGSNEEWQEGWEPYLALYDQWCPLEMKARMESL